MIGKSLILLIPLSSTGLEGTLVPFHDFLSDVQKSTYNDMMAKNTFPTYRVRDELAFNEMRQHILSHYEGVNITRSFIAAHHFDCVLIESQPSLRGNKPAAPPPALKNSASAVKADPKQDIFCETGTIPMLRVSLERMLRHPTLAHFFAKSPHGPRPYLYDSIPHKYAHAYQSVPNIGGESSLGIWNPQGDFTLSQQWFVAYTQSKAVQTAECGNLHYPGFFGPDAVLFIYHTNNGYAQNSGCYNLDCAGFVQTDHTYSLGKGWTSYSTDGNRVGVTYSYVLFEGNWWFSLDGTNVGYYPASIYTEIDATAMAVGATEVDFGGETTHDGTDNWPQMGSSKFADAGWSHAAGHSVVRYFTAGVIEDVQAADHGQSTYYYSNASLTIDQESSSCYTIAEHEHDSNVGTWFTFGGPGGPASGCSSLGENNVLVV